MSGKLPITDGYLGHLQNDINHMNSKKLELQNKLADVRRELKYYFRSHILN